MNRPPSAAPVKPRVPQDIAQLFEAVNRRFDEVSRQTDQIRQAVEQFALRGPSGASGEASLGNGELELVVRNTTEAMEQAQRVREIVATLPEIASSHIDALTSLDQHIGTIDEHLHDLRQERLTVDSTTKQIDDRQRQIARALNVLREMLLKQAEEARQLLAAQSALRELVTTQRQEARAHLGGRLQSLERKLTGILVIAVLGLIAAGAAAVIGYLK